MLVESLFFSADIFTLEVDIKPKVGSITCIAIEPKVT